MQEQSLQGSIYGVSLVAVRETCNPGINTPKYSVNNLTKTKTSVNLPPNPRLLYFTNYLA